MNITVDRKDLAKLKKLYAKSKPGDTFKFKGQDVLHEYAKHLIEYAESQLK